MSWLVVNLGSSVHTFPLSDLTHLVPCIAHVIRAHVKSTTPEVRESEVFSDSEVARAVVRTAFSPRVRLAGHTLRCVDIVDVQVTHLTGDRKRISLLRRAIRLGRLYDELPA
ncbi:hypothetical protein [Deinococcus peraridilitoris]|uniref:Uncharacterized protein n=1 Tax=Deinococcus peraridilitoris (strain DSM 19664 / LMG 22246 / CIP 109416 / KR-200) TaxID=937777 RepID=K9ZZW8_DEIPD|nr:hypothetical protein [Deinococcus peraridilitoris]AFZ67121.1 hypothetical protein Deipe_1580 [Deinococcus peraridilitoris DSM 19664]